MRKIISLLMMVTMISVLFAGCSQSSDSSSEDTSSSSDQTSSSDSSDSSSETSDATTTDDSESMIDIDTLTVYFVPSRDPSEINTATEPLKQLLTDALADEGYNIGTVDIEVGTTYEAVGEALDAGTADIGFIPGGTYVLYDDGAQVILTATRAGLSKDSSDPADWNDGQATESTDEQVTYYKGLIVAGPSEKGQELLAKVNSGEALTAEDLEDANWAVRSTSSSSGYIYPSLWLQDQVGLSITDLPNVVQADSYASTISYLASGQADIGTIYADARSDYADSWESDYGRTASIWEETGVIGVTDNIYNDTISVSKNDDIMTDDFIEALQNAFINIGNSEEGKEVISIYSHEGYQIADDSDYDAERDAQALLQSME